MNSAPPLALQATTTDIEAGWDTADERKAVILLSLGFGLVGLDRFMILPMFPTIQKDLGLSYQDLGAITGILAITWSVPGFFMGRFSDRIGRRKVLVSAMVAFSLLVGVSGLAQGLVMLMAVRAVMGLADGQGHSVLITRCRGSAAGRS